MAVKYVSPYGNDSWGGGGPDPANGNTALRPYLTLAKCLGAAGIASGDVLQICPGTYRAVVTVSMTSATVETIVNGDVENASGFKDGSGVLVPGGEVVWSGWTTSDLAAGSSSALANMFGRDFLTFQKITFIPYTGSVIAATSATSINITLRDCTIINFYNSASPLTFTNAADIALNLLVERCAIFAWTHAIQLTLNTSAVADYDANFTVRNCLIVGGPTASGVRVTPTGAGAFKGGGGLVENCTIFTGVASVAVSGANISSTFPLTVRNSLLTGTISAATLGQIVENYNVIHANTPRTSVNVGANSLSGLPALMAPRFSFGQEALLNLPLRPFMAPMPGSPLLGFVPSTFPTVDLLGRPRPAGGASLSAAVGAFELHDTGARETGTTDAGGVGLVLTGPANQDLSLAVDDTATVITVRMRYDTNHGATTKPQLLLLANGEIGVAAQTVTMTAAVDSWETVSLASFTPAARGVVKLRLVSRPTAASGKLFADTVTVT